MCMKPLPSSSSLIVATSLMQQQHQQSLSSLDNATPSSPLDTFKDAHNNQQQPHTLPHLYTALLERSNLAMVSPPPSSNPSPTTSDPQSIDMAMDDTASSAMPSPNDDTLRMGNDFIQIPCTPSPVISNTIITSSPTTITPTTTVTALNLPTTAAHTEDAASQMSLALLLKQQLLLQQQHQQLQLQQQYHVQTPFSSFSSDSSSPPTPSAPLLCPLTNPSTDSTFLTPTTPPSLTIRSHPNLHSLPTPPSTILTPLAQIACHITLRLIAQRWKSTTPPPPPLLASHLTNLKQFTSIALRHSRPSTPHLLMHALLISHRLVSLPTLPPSITSPTHLLLVSLILSESHLSDTQTSTHLWSRVASIPPHTIATLKREALTHLAYNITVKEPEYAAWVRAVKKCFDNRPKDPPQTSQTYIHAMQGATIAAAQSTADMIKAVRRARALLVEGVGKRKAMEDREVVVKRVRTEHPPACCTLMMGPKAIAKCVNHPHPHPAVVKMRTGTRGEEEDGRASLWMKTVMVKREEDNGC